MIIKVEFREEKSSSSHSKSNKTTQFKPYKWLVIKICRTAEALAHIEQL